MTTRIKLTGNMIAIPIPTPSATDLCIELEKASNESEAWEEYATEKALRVQQLEQELVAANDRAESYKKIAIEVLEAEEQGLVLSDDYLAGFQAKIQALNAQKL